MNIKSNSLITSGSNPSARLFLANWVKNPSKTPILSHRLPFKIVVFPTVKIVGSPHLAMWQATVSFVWQVITPFDVGIIIKKKSPVKVTWLIVYLKATLLPFGNTPFDPLRVDMIAWVATNLQNRKLG